MIVHSGAPTSLLNSRVTKKDKSTYSLLYCQTIKSIDSNLQRNNNRLVITSNEYKGRKPISEENLAFEKKIYLKSNVIIQMKLQIEEG